MILHHKTMRKITELEAEYNEPLADIIAGFSEMGYNLTTTQLILGFRFDIFKAIINSLGITFSTKRVEYTRTNVNRKSKLYFGKSIYEWAEINRIGHKTIRGRLDNGWTEHDAIFTPVLSRHECGIRGYEAAKNHPNLIANRKELLGWMRN